VQDHADIAAVCDEHAEDATQNDEPTDDYEHSAMVTEGP